MKPQLEHATPTIKKFKRRTKMDRVRKSKKTSLLYVITLISLVLAGLFALKYVQTKNNPEANLDQKNSSETKEVVSLVQKILLLPTDKQPTVAKVEDPAALKKSNESFYVNVEKGDYLVIYTDRAIIYRKSQNKLINIAPIVENPKADQKENKQE